MTISVVACAESAREWNKTPCDYSIGVNDMMKFGHRPNALIVCNHRATFSQERRHIIERTRPVKLYTHCRSWEGIFTDIVFIRMRSYDGILRRDMNQVSTSDTSPFIGMSLAYNLGATKIILWGAEFRSHNLWNPRNPNWNMEYRAYRGMYNLLLEKGIEVFHGTDGSALDFIPTYGH